MTAVRLTIARLMRVTFVPSGLFNYLTLNAKVSHLTGKCTIKLFCLREYLTPVYTVNGENVTWNQNANSYRLHTEAKWEYACCAGITTPFSTGNNITTGQANYDGNYPYKNNAKGTFLQRTTAVGSFAPNPWGL